MKKVCVINFWDGAFDGDFFDFFFNTALGGIVYTNNQHEADVIISSVFGNVRAESRKTIMYIGENMRPSYAGYDYSLSFDHDTYGGRNFRLPLWYARLAWPGFEQKQRHVGANNHGYEPLIDIKSLMRPRKLDMTGKDKFCAMIAGNPENLRINMFNSISQYKTIEGYGNMFGNSLRKSKFAVLPEYKFCLCPENSVYDGYVTEKLVDAYAGGTVPIYSGAVGDEFNTWAFFNYQDKSEIKDMDDLVQTIKQWDTDDVLYRGTYEESLLNEEPSLNEALAFVRSIVK
jgi:hypothetical protein